ncbi:MAG TPA: LLM class flavin-dependent oxidoreductase [Microlunatus sp.]|nr:LLM class flavin-dependent oxidoreductase [Microlunatus sp.]
MTSPNIGIAFVPTLPPERLRPLARLAEESGLDEFWVWEDCFKESGIAGAAIALGATESITVGLGIMPAPLRNVALAAMETVTVARAFPGRFLPGIGHGVQHWMGQVGGRVASPLTLLREYAVALRSLLDGEEVTTSGRYVKLDQVKLDWPTEQRLPLLIGGTGPKSLALAGELGDATILGAPLSTEEIADSVRTTRKSADSPDHPVVASLITTTGAGAQERLDAEIPRWFREPGPGMGAAGDAEAIAAAVRDLADSGCTSVVIQPTQDEPDLDGLVRFIGREVKPLL